jgi:hypothetical protein
MTGDELPVAHVLVHVREALATDERVGELGLAVEECCDEDPPSYDAVAVVVRGTVSTAARKAGVVPVVTEVLRSYGMTRDVRDETAVAGATVPEREAEAL